MTFFHSIETTTREGNGMRLFDNLFVIADENGKIVNGSVQNFLVGQPLTETVAALRELADHLEKKA